MNGPKILRYSSVDNFSFILQTPFWFSLKTLPYLWQDYHSYDDDNEVVQLKSTFTYCDSALLELLQYFPFFHSLTEQFISIHITSTLCKTLFQGKVSLLMHYMNVNNCCSMQCISPWVF